jgi:hypothetical protein
MRKLLVPFLTGLLTLGMAGVASAAVLDWEGTFTLDLTDFGKSSMPGGGVATVNGSDGVIPAHLSTLRLAGSRGHVRGSFLNIVTDPDTAANGVAAIAWEGIDGGTGTFGVISGGAASTGTMAPNTMPINGVVKICILNTACTMSLPLPFMEPTTVNGVVGTGLRGIGVGGMQTIGGYGGIRMSLQHGPWTIKTMTQTDQITTPGGERVFTPVTDKGWVHAPVSTTSSTAQPGGVVQLVTPNQVETNLPLGSMDKVTASGVLVIRFIPEPGLLVLLASGVTGLAILGRRRM